MRIRVSREFRRWDSEDYGFGEKLIRIHPYQDGRDGMIRNRRGVVGRRDLTDPRWIFGYKGKIGSLRCWESTRSWYSSDYSRVYQGMNFVIIKTKFHLIEKYIIENQFLFRYNGYWKVWLLCLSHNWTLEIFGWLIVYWIAIVRINHRRCGNNGVKLGRENWGKWVYYKGRCRFMLFSITLSIFITKEKLREQLVGSSVSILCVSINSLSMFNCFVIVVLLHLSWFPLIARSPTGLKRSSMVCFFIGVGIGA